MADVSTRCLAKLCSAGYNGNKALITPAAITSLADCGWSTTKDDIHPIGEPNPAVDGGVEGFVIRAVSAEDSGHATAIVVIRGTRSEAEWKASYNYKLVALPLPDDLENSTRFLNKLRPHCHEGFLSMWAPIASQLRGTLVSLDCHTWLFCGNSRGGAMATIAAVDCGIRLLPDLHTAIGRPLNACPADTHARAIREVAKAVTAAAAATTSLTASTPEASATSSTPEASLSTVPRVQCVTFASPRAGNGAFVQLLRRTLSLYAQNRAPHTTASSIAAAAAASSSSSDVLRGQIDNAVSTSHKRGAVLGRCERWVVGRDLVPTIPPAILGYRHAPGCQYVKDLSAGQVPCGTAAVGAAGAAIGHLLLGATDDHNIDRLVAWFDAELTAGRAPWEVD